MCSRFEINLTPRDIFKRLGLIGDPEAFQTIVPRIEVRPTDSIIAIMPSGPVAMRWGWEVSFSPRPMINARSETLTEKPTFRDYLQNRCLIPATAYFEWRTPEGETKKRRNRIYAKNEPTLLFAGLFNEQDSATIVTSAPLESIAYIHNRMPVALTPERAARWMSDAPFSDISDILMPNPTINFAATEDVPPPPKQGDLFAS